MNFCFCDTKITDWLQALGALATFGAFIFLICDRDKQQKQINELAKLARTAEQKLKLSVMPDFSEIKSKGFTGSIGSSFGFELKNTGGKAIVYSVIEKNNKLVIQYGNPAVQPEGSFVINANAPTENPILNDYEIEVKFRDMIGATYSQKIIIQKANPKLEQATENNS